MLSRLTCVHPDNCLPGNCPERKRTSVIFPFLHFQRLTVVKNERYVPVPQVYINKRMHTNLEDLVATMADITQDTGAVLTFDSIGGNDSIGGKNLSQLAEVACKGG